MYLSTAKFMLYMRIDDPLDATAIHLACGYWGLIAVGLFGNSDSLTGLFYGEGTQLGDQLLGGLVIGSYAGVILGGFYFTMNMINPKLLRVSLDIEMAGDLVLYGGSAYPSFQDEAGPPDGDVCMIIIDIHDSAALWEWNADVMKAAIEVYEASLRRNITRCYGYEMTDEKDGEALSVVFHNPFDAVKFALTCQSDLMLESWPDKLKTHPSCQTEDGWSGLRIKMAMDTGHATKFMNAATNRPSYKGNVVKQTQAVLDAIGTGGVNVTTTTAIQDLHNQFSHRTHELGAFFVRDLGTYDLAGYFDENASSDASVALIQVMPESLSKRPLTTVKYRSLIAHSLSSAPGIEQKDGAHPACCFMFCNFRFAATGKKVDAGSAFAEKVASIVIREAGLNNGYVSKDSNGVYLLAFGSPNNAMGFVNKTADKLNEHLDSDGIAFFAGIHQGVPISVKPNKTSGRADYLGPPVNASARLLALASDSSKKFLGTIAAVGVSRDAYDELDAEARAMLESSGHYNLKGVANEMEVFKYKNGVNPYEGRSSRRSSRVQKTSPE